jgi:uncharacterized Zn finger protein (UPF0148 family)
LDKIEFLNSLGFTPISEDLNDNLEVKCKNGHTFKRAYKSFKRGITSCPICEKEEKIKILNDLGFTLISEDLNSNVEVKCKHNHTFKRAFDTFKRGATDCPICEKEEKIRFLNDLGFTPISKDLGNNLEVKCKYNHTFKRTFVDFKKGTTSCPICDKEKRHSNIPSTKQERIAVIESKGYKVLEWEGDKITLQCKNNHTFTRNFSNLRLNNIECASCNEESKKQTVESLGYKLLKIESNNLEVECKKGHVFKRQFNNFKIGYTKCPECEKEEKVEFLNSLGFTPISKDLSNNLEVKCKHNHTFKRTYNSFKNGYVSCPICEKEEKLKFLSDLGFTPTSKDLNVELEVKCESCNNTFKRTFSNFKKVLLNAQFVFLIALQQRKKWKSFWIV